MHITQITVRSGRVIPHPEHQYANLRADVEFTATLAEDDDAQQCRAELHAMAESKIEQHMAEVRDGVRELRRWATAQTRVRQLAEQLEEAKADLGEQTFFKFGEDTHDEEKEELF